MATKAILYMVDYLAAVDVVDPAGKGETIKERHNKRIVVASDNFSSVLGYLYTVHDISNRDILEIKRMDEIEIDPDLFLNAK